VVTAWKKRLGEEIGKARRLHSDHLTQEQLAEIAGLCRNSIGHYERGERAPDFDELRRIAIALSREHFDVDENIRIEFSPNGKTHLQTPPQQLNLDFDENHGVSVRIEPVGQGLVIRKISA
jgi:transcriptional regulator with XRE-family HTH domain